MELARMHSPDDTSGIPIIMMSTKDQETDRIWGLRQGAFDYLVKPVKKRALLQCVDSAAVNESQKMSRNR